MNWILLVVAICFGAWAIWIADSAERHDKKMHVEGKLPSWNHIEVMAGYWTIALFIGAIALAMLVIAVI